VVLLRALGNSGPRGLVEEERPPVLDVVGSGGGSGSKSQYAQTCRPVSGAASRIPGSMQARPRNSAASANAHTYTMCLTSSSREGAAPSNLG
jgi:hypothetical protein